MKTGPPKSLESIFPAFFSPEYRVLQRRSPSRVWGLYAVMRQTIQASSKPTSRPSEKRIYVQMAKFKWPSFKTSLTLLIILSTNHAKQLSLQCHHYLIWGMEGAANLFARSLFWSFVLNSFISASLNWSSDCNDWSWKAKATYSWWPHHSCKIISGLQILKFIKENKPWEMNMKVCCDTNVLSIKL